ncbi:unnamed protein product, partial [Gadus morhua 'NCC']
LGSDCHCEFAHVPKAKQQQQHQHLPQSFCPIVTFWFVGGPSSSTLPLSWCEAVPPRRTSYTPTPWNGGHAMWKSCRELS